MAAQDVRALVPRVRRAIEGPRPVTGVDALTSDQIEALAADCIADIILMTAGAWNHALAASEMSEAVPPFPLHWTVTPELSLEEESVIAAQAALTWHVHQFKDLKVSERIQNEGRSWEWQRSATLLGAHLKVLKETRDAALDALAAKNPVLARYASFLETRDALMSAQIEPWIAGGLGVDVLVPISPYT